MDFCSETNSFESRLKNISNRHGLQKLNLKWESYGLLILGLISRLEPQSWLQILLKIKGLTESSIFGDHDCENTLEFKIMITCLPREGMKHLLKAQNHFISFHSKSHSNTFLLSSSLLNPKEGPTSSHLLFQISPQNPWDWVDCKWKKTLELDFSWRNPFGEDDE